MREVRKVMELPDFKGYLSDLGGPSANMYGMEGRNKDICGRCKRPSCIHPQVCPNLNTDHSKLLDVYKAVDAIPGIKKSFIGSGVRYDLLLHKSKDDTANRAARQYTHELICRHVSGRLKVAPEHVSDRVLGLMRKPPFKLFEDYPLFYQQSSRLPRGRHGRACRTDKGHGLSSRTGTGLHTHTNDDKHRDMVHRIRPLYA